MGQTMSELDLEGDMLQALETVLLELHDRSSLLSNLIDVPSLTPATAGIPTKLIRDIGEISRQNMILLEDIVGSVRSLRELHRVRPRPPLRVAMSPRRLKATQIAIVLAGIVLGFLIAAFYWVPGSCARGMLAEIAQRAT